MPAKPTSLRNQANAIQPFNYAQASGPELPSSIAAINTINAGEMEVMQIEQQRRESDEAVAQRAWEDENGDLETDWMIELDPTSEGFDEEISKVSRRAMAMPGFKDVFSLKLKQRDEHRRGVDKQQTAAASDWKSTKRRLQSGGVRPGFIRDLESKWKKGEYNDEERDAIAVQAEDEVYDAEKKISDEKMARDTLDNKFGASSDQARFARETASTQLSAANKLQSRATALENKIDAAIDKAETNEAKGPTGTGPRQRIQKDVDDLEALRAELAAAVKDAQESSNSYNALKKKWSDGQRGGTSTTAVKPDYSKMTAAERADSAPARSIGKAISAINDKYSESGEYPDEANKELDRLGKELADFVDNSTPPTTPSTKPTAPGYEDV